MFTQFVDSFVVILVDKAAISSQKLSNSEHDCRVVSFTSFKAIQIFKNLLLALRCFNFRL